MSRAPNSGGILAKLAVMVGVAALTAAWLLSVRQQRIMAAHDLISAHRRMAENERTLWRLRVEIANLLTPDRIEQIAGTVGPMEPISPRRLPPGVADRDKALAGSRELDGAGSDYR
ncbi:MAG: hypothetical protein IBJ10_10660 [Phycisphaerales bacterium]|nr:hypothetical protein [Phycisphaerales bacterium]